MDKITLLKKLYKHKVELFYDPYIRTIIEVTTIIYDNGNEKIYITDKLEINFKDYSIKDIVTVTKNMKKIERLS